MEFASKFAFMSPSVVGVGAPAAPPGARRGRFDVGGIEEAPTNVISMDLSKLATISFLATGDPTLCGHCNAVLSHLSKIDRSEDGTYIWNCEYCSAVNTGLRLEPEELPSAMSAPDAGTTAGSSKGVDFLLVPPNAAPVSDGSEDGDDSAIIFCTDVSGSMCITEELSGAAAAKLKLRGAADRASEFDALRMDGDDMRQFNRGGGGFGRRGPAPTSQYVSRLQGLQAAISSQVETLTKTKPNKRIGLVAFSSDVVIYGDAVSSQPVVLTGSSKLQDFGALLAAGEGNSALKPVKMSAKGFTDKLWALREEGSTALGPAVVAALGMLSGKRGGRIVIATDGLANQGLGSLDAPELPKGASSEAKQQAIQTSKLEADDFFARVQGLAIEKGVVIDVIGFSGSNCNLEALSRLSDATGGSVSRVDVKTIADEFSSVLAEEIRATSVSLTMIGHKALHISDPTQDVTMAEGDSEDDNELEVGQEHHHKNAHAAPGSDSTSSVGFSVPAPSAPVKAKKESLNHRQLRQVAALYSSPADKASSAAPSASAAGAGAVDLSKEAPPSVDLSQVQSVAGLLAQKHGLRAGKVAAAPVKPLPVPALAAVPEDSAAGEAVEDDESAAAAPAAPAPKMSCFPPPRVPPVAKDGESEKHDKKDGPKSEEEVHSQSRQVQPSASATTLFIGNVTDSSEASFEYRQKTPGELARVPGLQEELNRLTSLPFQLQIAYTAKDGGSYLRIITASQPITRAVDEALKSMDAQVMTSHAARSAAGYAKKGLYGQSATVASRFKNVIASNIRADDRGQQAFQSWSVDADQLTRTLNAEVASERPKMKKSAVPRSSAAPAPPSAAVSGGGAGAPRVSSSGGGFFRGIASAFGYGGGPSSSSAASAAPLAQAAAKPVAFALAAPSAADKESSLPPMPETAAAYAGSVHSDAGDDDDGIAEEEDEAEADARMSSVRAERRQNNDELAAQISRMMKGGKRYGGL